MTAIRRLPALATTAIITAAATVPSPLQAQESKRKPTKMKTIDPAENPKVEHRIREFLKALNSGGGKPIEALTPAEARKVLMDAQASVPLDLPACDIEEKTITQDGLKVSLNIVRPGGSKAVLPASSSSTAAAGSTATFRPTSVSSATWWSTAASLPYS
jgi:hypothetical protein